MFDDLLALIDPSGAGPAIRRPSGRPATSRAELTSAVHRLAAALAALPRTASDAASEAGVWVAARDPYLMLVCTLGCLYGDSAALVDADGPAAGYDALAGVHPPRAVVCDNPAADVARWAVANGTPLLVADEQQLTGHGSGAPGLQPARTDAKMYFFSSGTTGVPKCVGVGAAALVSAVRGVSARLALGPDDTSVSITPLTHTLGMVTTVLVGLASGGAVAFADPRRPREFLDTVTELAPTWCAASPSGHAMALRLLRDAGRPWPRLRFLRASSAPLTDDLTASLEEHYAVPVVNAYVMTEAPGEIASQDLTGERRRGTVGRPSLCQVDIRPADGSASAEGAGEIWIRGPNVAALGPSSADGWLPTGDIGLFDDAGFLRVTGRNHDIINHGGLKVWPPDVEAVALRHGSVAAAIAFPIPHDGLGETVGLAVVPMTGRSVERGEIRRLLMADLPRHAWPSSIVVCAEIPRSARGKIQRRLLWQTLVGVRTG